MKQEGPGKPGMGGSLASGLREAGQRGGHGDWEVQTSGIYGWEVSNPPLVILCVCVGSGREIVGVHLAKPLEAKGRNG